MSHDPKNVHLTEMPLPPELPPDQRHCCSHCGFYRPSTVGLDHHPKCPHASAELVDPFATPERLKTADMCEDITARLLTSQRDDPPLYPQLMQKVLQELKRQADESLDPALFHWARWLLEQVHHRATSGIPYDEPQEDPHV